MLRGFGPIIWQLTTRLAVPSGLLTLLAATSLAATSLAASIEKASPLASTSRAVASISLSVASCAWWALAYGTASQEMTDWVTG